MAYPDSSQGLLQHIGDLLAINQSDKQRFAVSNYPNDTHGLLQRIRDLLAAGMVGSVASYIFTQVAPSEQWTINHNLGFRPIVMLLNSGGMEIDGEIVHLSENVVTASFGVPVAGMARCL